MPATPAEIRAYPVRRVARLWPVVALAVGLSWFLAPTTAGRTVLGNDPNLWSLDY
ncbi:MAG: hypothetical protein H7343_11405 [Undibacterium sp.]|nr:hypothetical protein [Opitutaceae bacterium]